jgi:hypothetical protein
MELKSWFSSVSLSSMSPVMTEDFPSQHSARGAAPSRCHASLVMAAIAVDEVGVTGGDGAAARFPNGVGAAQERFVADLAAPARCFATGAGPTDLLGKSKQTNPGKIAGMGPSIPAGTGSSTERWDSRNAPDCLPKVRS